MKGAVKIILVCLAALLVVGGVSLWRMRAENDRIAREFVGQVAALHQRQQVENDALQARFNAIDLDHYLEADTLVSADGVREGRETVTRYRALLAERDAMAERDTAQGMALIEALPAGMLRDQARRGAANSSPANKALRAELSRAQVANADAMLGVIDWADRNHGHLQARGGKLIVANQQQLDELNAVQATLATSAQAVHVAMDKVKVAQSAATKSLANLQREVQQP